MNALLIDEKLLKSKRAVCGAAWQTWEKKSLGIHRGVIDWSMDMPAESIDEIARQIRLGVKKEFKPGWLRGFGFGVILRVKTVPNDFVGICKHIDTRNKLDGVWQWVVVCLEANRVALGVHTWQRGYLHPVYDSILEQLASSGYQCHSVDAKIDPLIETLQEVGKVCHLFGGINGLIKG